MACSSDPVAVLVAVAGVRCRRPAPGGGSSVAVSVPVVVVGVAQRVRSYHGNHRTAVFAPICPADRSTRHPTARSHPGHNRSRNTADHTDCRIPRDVVAVAVAAAGGRVVGAPDRNIAAVVAVVAGGSCRTAVAGTPCWRFRLAEV